MKWLDDLFERKTRKVAQQSSRRGKSLCNGPTNAARTAGNQGRRHSGCEDGLRCAHAHFAFV